MHLVSGGRPLLKEALCRLTVPLSSPASSDSQAMDYMSKYPSIVGTASPVFSSRATVYRWILFYALITTVPLAAAVAVLVYLVFAHRVSSISTSSEYLIDYDLSVILTISSWAATVAVLLPGFVMATYSYIVARQVYEASSVNPPRYTSLPSPQQYVLSTLILEFGGIGSLWRYLNNAFQRTSPPNPGYLKTAAGVLTVMLLLCWGITAADTWLHAVSSTILSDSLIPSPSHASYGRRIGHWCHEDGSACHLNLSAYTVFILNDTEAMTTVMNTSTTNRVYTVNSTAILLHSNLPETQDFIATTFGMRASCTPKTRACKLDVHPCVRCWPFDCTDAGFPLARGDLYSLPYTEHYFFESDKGFNQSMHIGSPTANPFRFAAAAYIQSISQSMQGDPEIRTDQRHAAMFICNAEIVEVTVQQTVGRLTLLDSKLSKDRRLVGTITGTTAATTYYVDILRQQMLMAGTSPNSVEMGNYFAAAFARTFTALVAGSTTPVPNTLQWTRSQHLLARVPVAPFWTLVGLCGTAVMVAAAIVLGAMVTVAGKVDAIGQVKARLCPEGVAAVAWEDTKGAVRVSGICDMFQEHKEHGRIRKIVVRANRVGGMDVIRHGL